MTDETDIKLAENTISSILQSNEFQLNEEEKKILSLSKKIIHECWAE